MRTLVTGAARGIGAATARRLRAEGAEVWALDMLDPGEAADRWLRVDLGAPQAVDGLVLPGPFDALVNAAGLPPRLGTEVAVLAVNLLGLRRLTERLLPEMAEGGAIVNVASKAGARWRENLAQVRRALEVAEPAALPGFVEAEGIDPVRAYDLSKEAVILWTKLQTRRLQAMGLRANSVSPAAVETAILPDFEAAFGDRARRGTALMGRAGTVEEVAAVAAFLCRPESGWVKGQDIPVDGGLAAMLELEALGLTP
jgi:NAD(P)-dependent dehydrogenase (short-subunit alcohol dehydrogenase family)